MVFCYVSEVLNSDDPCLMSRLIEDWPDEEPSVGRNPGGGEEESEAETEAEPGAGGRRGEGPREGDCPGKVGDQQHLDQEEDAGPGQGAVQPASVKADILAHF